MIDEAPVFTTGFTMIRLSQNHDGIIFALVTACDPGAITTRARIVDADGGNALTPVGLVHNQILSLPQWSGVVPVISALILSTRFKPESTNTA